MVQASNLFLPNKVFLSEGHLKTTLMFEQRNIVLKYDFSQFNWKQYEIS